MKLNYIFLLLFCITTSLNAQQEKKLNNELKGLKDKITELETIIKKKEQEEELQKLLEEANDLSIKEKKEEVNISKRFRSGVRQQQGLNPNISVGGDFFGSISSIDETLISEPSDFSYGNNNFYIRELELALIAPLDPFTRGKAFIAISEDAISIEEAYMELLNLPLNMNLRAGIFRAEYGLLNRYHDHALPQFGRPKVHINYFSVGGLAGPGVASSFLLPKLLFSNASSFDFSVIEGGTDFSFTTGKRTNLLYIGHLKNYYDLSENSYLEYTLSGVAGKNDTTLNSNSYVGSFGIHYKYVPAGRAKYKTFNWKTEFYYGLFESPVKNIYSRGFYSSIQNKLNSRFWIGGRIGYSELPYDNKQSEWDYTINLDFWQSDFIFYRIQYQYNDRNINNMLNQLGTFPSNHSILLQISWAMGPHKHEAY